MNTNELSKLLKKYFHEEDMEIASENIIRCNRKYKDKIYEVYYFDISKNWIDTYPYITNYLNAIIKTDYYSDSGCLQWNYYFVFLHESDINIDKKEIEENEDYARKFVVKVKLLDDWLESRFKFTSISKPIINSKDLSIIWMEELKKNKLDCVYLDVSYENGLYGYLRGDPIKDTEDTGNSRTFNFKKDNVTQISHLCLENYRPSPKKKNFEFGKVNLIFGKNGTGKTSLLEAIELFICGKNFRNPKKIDTNTSIKVKYENESSYTDIDLTNATKYRKRDSLWYNNAYINRNNLYISFNKFNFYDTDSASSLSRERGISTDIVAAFQDIALGPQVNYIDGRLKNYFEKFEKEVKICDEAIQEHQRALEKETESLEYIKNNDDNVEQFFNNFIQVLSSIGWKGQISKKYEDKFIAFENDYIVLNQNLKQLLKNIDGSKNNTPEAIYRSKENYINLSSKFTAINQKTDKLKVEINQLSLNYDLLNCKIDILNKLKRYLSNKSTVKLIGLDEKISELQLKISKYQEATDYVKNIDFDLYTKYKDCTLDAIEGILKAKILETNETKLSLVKEIDRLEIYYSKLEKLVTEIKTKGFELISSFSGIQVCPLCNTTFEGDNLRKIIGEIYENIDEPSNLKYLISEKDKVTAKLNCLDKDYDNVQLIKSSVLVLNGIDNLSNSKLITILDKLNMIIKEKSEISYKLDELMSLKKHFNSNGYSEQEYQLLIEKNIKDNNFVANEITEDFIEYELSKYQGHFEDTFSRLNECNSEVNEQNLLLRNIFSQYFNDLNPRDLKVLIHKELEKINESSIFLQNISNFIKVHLNEPITKIQEKLEILYSVFEKFKEEKEKRNQINILMQERSSRIDEVNKNIFKLNERKVIAQNGYFAIEHILNQCGKEKYLHDFLEENKREIINIFKLIHTPKEFKNIYFEIGSPIILKRENSEEDAELSTISTGQRAALALSVFLSLNKKLQNGPPFLIFDDPIAHVDDLNMLSFLDYLREIVINTNRQIFFATANENLAFLFHQKFAFLGGSEFKVHKL